MGIFAYLNGKNWQSQNTAERNIYVPVGNSSPIPSFKYGLIVGQVKNLTNYVHEPTVPFNLSYRRPSYLIAGSVPSSTNTQLQGAVPLNG